MRRRQFFEFENDKDNFFAGIEYIGEKEIDLNDGLNFITLQENFKVLEVNKYFSVNRNELIVLKCKPNALVNLKWEIFVLSKEKISLSFRILQNKKIIDSTRVNGYSDEKEIQNFGSSLVQINSKDEFTIQIKNNDLKKPTEKIIITKARLILEG